MSFAYRQWARHHRSGCGRSKKAPRAAGLLYSSRSVASAPLPVPRRELPAAVGQRVPMGLHPMKPRADRDVASGSPDVSALIPTPIAGGVDEAGTLHDRLDLWWRRWCGDTVDRWGRRMGPVRRRRRWRWRQWPAGTQTPSHPVALLKLPAARCALPMRGNPLESGTRRNPGSGNPAMALQPDIPAPIAWRPVVARARRRGLFHSQRRWGRPDRDLDGCAIACLRWGCRRRWYVHSGWRGRCRRWNGWICRRRRAMSGRNRHRRKRLSRGLLRDRIVVAGVVRCRCRAFRSCRLHAFRRAGHGCGRRHRRHGGRRRRRRWARIARIAATASGERDSQQACKCNRSGFHSSESPLFRA